VTLELLSCTFFKTQTFSMGFISGLLPDHSMIVMLDLLNGGGGGDLGPVLPYEKLQLPIQNGAVSHTIHHLPLLQELQDGPASFN
jgi:hypothetical protein